MKKFLGIIFLIFLWSNFSNAEIIEFNKCYPKKIDSPLFPDQPPLIYKSWDEWNIRSGGGIVFEGIKGSDIQYKDVVFTFDTANGLVIQSKIYTDEYLTGMNKALRKDLNERIKLWQKDGKKGKMPTAKYLTKIEKNRFRLLEYSGGYISFDDPAYAERYPGQYSNYELNISDLTIHESHVTELFISTQILQCESSHSAKTEAVSSSGTAFFINNRGHLLTNNHVVAGCKLSKINYKNKDYDAKLIATDKTLDLALLKADLKPKSFFTFSKDEAKKLNKIYVAGYPLGKGLSDDLKISSGIVSSLKGFEDNSNEIQIDAPINPGNSGGPIINENGDLIAIAVSGLAKDQTEGINFGIKSSAAETFLKTNKINPKKSMYSGIKDNDQLLEILEEGTVYTYCNN